MEYVITNSNFINNGHVIWSLEIRLRKEIHCIRCIHKLLITSSQIIKLTSSCSWYLWWQINYNIIVVIGSRTSEVIFFDLDTSKQTSPVVIHKDNFCPCFTASVSLSVILLFLIIFLQLPSRKWRLHSQWQK